MLQHGRDSSLSSISGSFNDSCSIASSGSPGPSPINSPYMSPTGSGSPRELLNQQFANSMSLQPPPTSTTNNSKSGNSNSANNNNNTFVHKLYNMVVDVQYQHLIAWNYTGSSFIVCNIMEFSRDVLPKHFKHNNFSSFVRQLNMYGFHKVNKSPRGHKTLAENQIWEFSHLKFIKNRPDLLDEIKRKSLENNNESTINSRRGMMDYNDMNTHMAMMQVSQSEMVQQLNRLQDNFNQVMRELQDTKSKQMKQQQVLKNMMDFLTSRGGQLQVPPELNTTNYINNGMMDLTNTTPVTIERPTTPSIFITSHDVVPSQQQQNNTQHYYNNRPPPPPILTVQTHNLNTIPSSSSLSPNIQHSPALSAYHTALNTPVSPSPTSFISDDDIPSLNFSPHHSPMTTPNTFALNNNTFTGNGNNGSVVNTNGKGNFMMNNMMLM